MLELQSITNLKFENRSKSVNVRSLQSFALPHIIAKSQLS